MDHAVNKDDVQHIIIDNLQFMMPVASNQVCACVFPLVTLVYYYFFLG